MSGATIMIVEDDGGTRRTLCGILEDAGYEVIEVERATDALKTIRENSCDLVITDIRLPDASGMEIVSEVRRIKPEAVVMIITGYASVETATEAVRQGAYAYFIKPVNPDELTIDIANALRQQRLVLENKRLLDDFQRLNELLLKANEELQEEVAERRLAEEALRESEERYRGLINNIQVGIFRSTPEPEGRLLGVNPAMERIYGYSRDELLKMEVSDLYVHPEDRVALTRELLSVGQVKKEFLQRRKDGREIVASTTITGVRDEKGDVVYFDGIAEDITERKQVEEALRETQKKFRALVETTSDFIWEMNLDGIYTYCSPQMEKLWGFKPGEMVGKTPFDLLPTEQDREQAVKAFSAILESGAPFANLEAPSFDGTGQIRFLEISGVPFSDTNGEIAGYRGITRDITERKQAEEALRESEEKYRTLVENATDFIYMIDTDDRILSLNQSAARLLGKEAGELIGSKVFDIFPPEMAAWFSKEFRLTFKTGKTIMAEAKLNVGGKEIWASTSLSPIRNESNEIVAVMGVTRDITEQKRMERELQEKNEQLDEQNEELRVQSEELIAQQQELVERTEEVARANQLKSEFLANMSHELRTPLNTIIGFSQLMIDGVPGKINAEQGQCLSDVLESSQHLLNLINEVLDLSKIESTRTKLKQESVVLAELVTPLTRSMMPILRPKKQSLNVEIEEGLPPVYADKGKLGQVLRNLVTNSSKFTPAGGELRIKATSDDGWCRLSIIDNGVGIKKEDQERIFEPFCQLDYTPVDGKAGTGLGLAVVRQIVEKHGGEVWVEGEYGKGSQFTFTMPLVTKDKPPREGNKS